MIVREEQPADGDAVRAIVVEAFGGTVEADLIDQLRVDGDVVIALVAVTDVVIGHVLFSRMQAPLRALGLGPVAVRPAWQGTASAPG